MLWYLPFHLLLSKVNGIHGLRYPLLDVYALFIKLLKVSRPSRDYCILKGKKTTTTIHLVRLIIPVLKFSLDNFIQGKPTPLFLAHNLDCLLNRSDFKIKVWMPTGSVSTQKLQDPMCFLAIFKQYPHRYNSATKGFFFSPSCQWITLYRQIN